MKERKFKKFEKVDRNEIYLIIGYIIWFWLCGFGSFLIVTNVSLWKKVTHIVITAIYTVWGINKIVKLEKERERQKIEKEK